MKQLLNIKKVRLMSFGVTLSFLMIHIALFLLFSHCGVEPMRRFNIFSMAFYTSMLLVIQKNRFRAFVTLSFLEVVAHMVAATYFTGWSSGFQTTLIGLCILPFCAEYIAHSIHLPYVKSVALGVVAMAGYLIICYIDHSRPAPYPLPEDIAYILRMSWGVVVFSMVLTFLEIYVRTASISQDMLSEEVTHDQLTGLPNRYYVSDYLNGMLDEAGLEGCWIAMVDIDDFKVINDTYGHNCGDFVLRELANLFNESSIEMEVCRWGGEEFLLIGRIGGSLEAQLETLDGLRRHIMNHSFDYEGVRLKLTITIGVAEFASGLTIREWIERADQRLYDGKTNGKNQVVA